MKVISQRDPVRFLWIETGIMYVNDPGIDVDSIGDSRRHPVYIAFFSNRIVYIVPVLGEKVHAERGEKFSRFQTIFEFYIYIMNILPIRQIDHAFIPLFFHWSGRYIKRQLRQDGFISDFTLRIFVGIRLIVSGCETILSPVHTIVPECFLDGH